MVYQILIVYCCEKFAIPLQDLGKIAEQVHVLTREAATNTELDMREFLGIDKALRSFKGKIVNNLAKLSEVDKQLNRDQEKLEEIKDDFSYSDELKDSIRKRIDEKKVNEKQGLKALLINRNKLRSQRFQN